MSLAAFYLSSQKEIERLTHPDREPGFPWSALARLPLVLALGIGLCVNQTRAVLEAALGKNTEFVRTPKHGIRGKLGSWTSKKYRAARSLTPLVELGLAGYFLVALAVAYDHGHYLSMPFLGLFLFGFGYVGGLSLWQGEIGQALRESFSGARLRPPSIPTAIAVPLRRRESQGAIPAIQLTEEWGTGSAISLVSSDKTSPGMLN
jgi:hypothetical protein